MHCFKSVKIYSYHTHNLTQKKIKIAVLRTFKHYRISIQVQKNYTVLLLQYMNYTVIFISDCQTFLK